jgi:single-strand DNA-binding protein
VNTVILLGGLTKTPEIKVSGETKILNFSIAVTRKTNKDKVSYINCVAFNKTAEIIGQYADKGSKIIIEGELQSRSYEKDNQKIYVTEVVVNTVTVIDWKQKDKVEVEAAPSPRTQALLGNHDKTIDKRLEEAKTLDSDDLPF